MEKKNPPAMSFKEFFKFFELTCLSYLWLSLSAIPPTGKIFLLLIFVPVQITLTLQVSV